MLTINRIIQDRNLQGLYKLIWDGLKTDASLLTSVANIRNDKIFVDTIVESCVGHLDSLVKLNNMISVPHVVYAITYRNLNMLYALLKHGADPNKLDSNGNPPILYIMRLSKYRSKKHNPNTNYLRQVLKALYEYGGLKRAFSSKGGFNVIDLSLERGNDMLFTTLFIEKQKHGVPMIYTNASKFNENHLKKAMVNGCFGAATKILSMIPKTYLDVFLFRQMFSDTFGDGIKEQQLWCLVSLLINMVLRGYKLERLIFYLEDIRKTFLNGSRIADIAMCIKRILDIGAENPTKLYRGLSSIATRSFREDIGTGTTYSSSIPKTRYIRSLKMNCINTIVDSGMRERLPRYLKSTLCNICHKKELKSVWDYIDYNQCLSKKINNKK